MMGGQDRAEAAPFLPFAKRRVTCKPGLFLKISVRHLYWQGFMPYPQSLADIGNHRCLFGALWPQAMVDRCRFNPIAHSGLGQQQQRKAVRPAGNGHAKVRVGRNQAAKFAAKARNQFAGKRSINCISPFAGWP